MVVWGLESPDPKSSAFALRKALAEDIPIPACSGNDGMEQASLQKTLKCQQQILPEQHRFNEVQNVGLLHSNRNFTRNLSHISSKSNAVSLMQELV